MAAKIIDGAGLAAAVRREVAGRIAQLNASGQAVQLTAILKLGLRRRRRCMRKNQARSTRGCGD